MKVPCLRVLKRREMIHMTNHIYKNHEDQVEELLSREPYPLPTLEISDEAKQFRGLEGLLAMRYENLKLVGYQSHGKISAAVAV
ncbi:MAG TPA: thymidylate synthase [Pyrinomonadaceae bacterium]|nr:thymidylate synthase [Pyrinomonadaceae bacterium]